MTPTSPPRPRPTATLPTVPLAPVPAPHEVRRGGGARVLASLAAVVVAVAVLVGTYVVAVLDPTGRAVDDAVMHAVMRRGAGLREGMAMLLDAVTVPAVVLLVMALALLAVLRGRPRVAVGVVALVLGSQALTQVLKTVLPRAGDPEGNSLPSGHVTLVVALGVALVAVLPRAARPLVALVATVVAALYGVATMVSGWHRPSDLAAAAAVVLLVAGLTVLGGAVSSRRQGRSGLRASTICST